MTRQESKFKVMKDYSIMEDKLLILLSQNGGQLGANNWGAIHLKIYQNIFHQYKVIASWVTGEITIYEKEIFGEYKQICHTVTQSDSPRMQKVMQLKQTFNGY